MGTDAGAVGAGGEGGVEDEITDGITDSNGHESEVNKVVIDKRRLVCIP